MALTEDEKNVGRLFRDDCAAGLREINTQQPPTYVVPFYLGHYRHLCYARKNKSKSIELKERYWHSPIYPGEGVPRGRFAFIFREGACLNCGHTARSEVGWLVDGHSRPPLTGRVARS